MSTILAVVIPCYNEEEILPETIKKLSNILDELTKDEAISENSYLYFIDDGSIDNTWKIIKRTSLSNKWVKGLKLLGNVGHQKAIYAGMEQTVNQSSCVISIDADLQDDETAIKEMITRFNEGFQVVYGVRNNRKTDSFFKRFTAEKFYKLMNVMGVKVVFNHADFRLLGKNAIVNFLEYEEQNIFIRGIIPLMGFKSANVYYKRKERTAGESKYPVKKMLSFAWEGITSFSIVPLKLITTIGFLIFIVTVIMGIYILSIVLFTDKAIQGWASTTLPIYFLGGVQLLSIGIIGEYIGKIYKEVKNRPRFFIEEKIN